MPVPAPIRRPRRRVVVGLGAVTLACFAAATAARIAVDRVIDGIGPVRSVAAVSPGPDPIAVINAAAMIGVIAVGGGVLLFGATLVAAVLQQRGPRLPIGLGALAVALVVAAVVVGVLAGRSADFGTVATLGTLRVAFAGLATASLPAIVLGAVRARAAHRRRTA